MKAQARRGHGAHGPCLTLTLVYSTTLSYNMQIIVKTRSGKSITLEVEETIDNAEIQDNEEYAQLNSSMAATPTTPSFPPVTITEDTLARALDKMGLTASVSPTLLYYTILQVQSSQSPPQSAQPPPPSQSPVPQSKSNHDILYDSLAHMAKADHPKGFRTILRARSWPL